MDFTKPVKLVLFTGCLAATLVGQPVAAQDLIDETRGKLL